MTFGRFMQRVFVSALMVFVALGCGSDGPSDEIETGQIRLPATVPSGFVDEVVATGLLSPTAMAFAPDGRLFVCQQGGQIRVIKNGALLSTPFASVTTTTSGERGLLGIAFDPNFATNQFVYIYYTATTPAVHNRVSRFRASGDVANRSQVYNLRPQPTQIRERTIDDRSDLQELS